MKKHVTFFMSSGPAITIPFELAEEMLKSERQIFPISTQKGEWSGKIINKSHIVSSKLSDDTLEQLRIDAQTSKELKTGQ